MILHMYFQTQWSREHVSVGFYEAIIPLITKPGTDIARKSNCRLIASINTDTKILKNISAKRVHGNRERIIYYHQV